MTAPTARVRADTYNRDNNRCVAADGECFGGLEWNHRENSGTGGRGSKATPVTVADGVTTCMSHNQRFETDMIVEARQKGWKILRNRGNMLASTIPYYDTTSGEWWFPLDLLRENPVAPVLAYALLIAACSISNEVGRLEAANSDAPNAQTSEASATPTPLRALGVTA